MDLLLFFITFYVTFFHYFFPITFFPTIDLTDLHESSVPASYRVYPNRRTMREYVCSFGCASITFPIWREKNGGEKTKECGSTWQCLHGSAAFTGVMRSVPSGEVMAANVATYEFDSFIRGYHVYMYSWTPEIGEILNCVPEKDNAHVRNAVSVIKESGAIVGHIPKENSRVCKFFIQRGMVVGLLQWRLPWQCLSQDLL